MSELQQAVWLREEEAPPLPHGWRYLPTEEACVQLKPGKLFENKTVAPEGAVPVINQSQDGIIGYHDEEPGVVASRAKPVVTFANHTCAMRLMTESFSCIQNVFPRIGKEGVTDTKYFYYASQGRVSISDYKGHHPVFRKTLIPIPPLPTQRKIAGILSAYDDLIENNLRRIKILEEMAQSLYREWFVHFRFPGHESVPFVESSLGSAPEGWGIAEIGAITTKVGSGATPRGGKDSYKSNGVPLIRSMNVYDYSFEFSDLAFLDSQQAAQLDNVTVEANDILLNITGASVCRCAMVPSYLVPARVNQHVAIIRADPGQIDPHYLLDCINSDVNKRKLFGLAQGGATREALTKEAICRFAIALPSLDLIRRYGKIAGPLHSLREGLQRRNQTLRRTRDLLLPKLLAGEGEFRA